MTRRTDAAILFETGSPLRIVSLEIPPLQPGQVLVEVSYSGVCASQLLEVRGKRGPDRFLPHALGHEGSGVVLATGEGVTKVQTGDRVVLSWIRGSGATVPSTVYGSRMGAINSGAISTFMRETITCESCVIRIPGSMPLREAALLGCAVLTGGGIVRNTARVGRGASVAVFGIGGIGLSAVLVAALVGADPIMAIDVFDHKLEHARKVGATHTVNARKQDVRAKVLKITKGHGADFAIEAAGRTETMQTALEIVREKGGLCVLAGNLPRGERISIDPFDLIKGKRLVGSWGGESDPDHDIPFFVDQFVSGKLRMGELITHEYRLEEVNAALDELERGNVGRSLIRMQ